VDFLLNRWILSVPKGVILRKPKPAVVQNFIKLQELCETGHTTIEDGRPIVLHKK